MKRNVTLLLLLAFFIFMSSISISNGHIVSANKIAAQQPSEVVDSKARVYVYRHKQTSTRNMQPSVYVDGDEVARIDDGKFFVVKLAPGKHTIMVNKGHSGAEIDMKAGEEYYFRVVIKAGTWVGHGQIDFVQKE
jgi:hypothetical protein